VKRKIAKGRKGRSFHEVILPDSDINYGRKEVPLGKKKG